MSHGPAGLVTSMRPDLQAGPSPKRGRRHKDNGRRDLPRLRGARLREPRDLGPRNGGTSGFFVLYGAELAICARAVLSHEGPGCVWAIGDDPFRGRRPDGSRPLRCGILPAEPLIGTEPSGTAG